MDNGVQSIGRSAFEDCYSLTDLHLSQEVKSIGASAFMRCTSLSVVELPSKVAIVGSSAFKMCPIQSIVLPESIIQIGFEAFSETGISSIHIPAGATKVEWLGISNLESITVAEGNPYLDSRDNCNAVIDTKQNKLVMGCKNTVIPSSVESIGIFAFHGTTLKQITIPETVLSIDYYAFDNCADLDAITFEGGKVEGEFDFKGCASLKTIKVPAKKTKYFMKRINAACHAFIVEQAPIKKVKSKTKAG